MVSKQALNPLNQTPNRNLLTSFKKVDLDSSLVWCNVIICQFMSKLDHFVILTYSHTY